MANNEELLRKMRAENFVKNNGETLRAINVLRHGFCPLRNAWSVLTKLMTEQEFLDCINFLQLEGYLEIRHMDSHQQTDIADAHYGQLEAKLSGKGIRLAQGGILDELVDM